MSAVRRGTLGAVRRPTSSAARRSRRTCRLRRAYHPQGADLQDTCCLRQVARDCSDFMAIDRSVTGLNHEFNPSLLRD